LLSAAALTSSHAAHARQYDPYAYEALFDAVLQHPGDAALNKRFARAAEARGDLRLAFAALERAVLSSSGDTEAQAEFDRIKSKLTPSVTRVTLEGGANYASNPRHEATSGSEHDPSFYFDPPFPYSTDPKDDATFDGKAIVVDERTISGQRWRSLGVAQGQWQSNITELNWQRVSIETGPVFQLNPKVWLYLAGGGAMVWLNESKLYNDISASVTVGGLYKGLTQTVTARYTRRDANVTVATLSDSDIADPSADKADIFDLEGRFAFSPKLAKGDLFYVMPRLQVSRNSGDPTERYEMWSSPFETAVFQRPLFPGDFTQLGGALAYYMPLLKGKAFLGAGIEMYQRWYSEHASTVTSIGVCNGWCFDTSVEDTNSGKRRDTYFEPTAHLIFPNFFAAGFDLRFDYRYEHNSSNASMTIVTSDGAVLETPADFANHVAGVHVVGRF
jgi:hypothetical protein